MRLLPHSLTAIRAFDAVARNMSCSKAAEELFITQSAVSKQLHSLEENLGVRLFIRVHQGLTLTEAGHVYWNEVRPALRMLAEAALRARAMQHDKESISLIVPPALCQKWLIPRLGDFVAHNPDIKIQFLSESAGEFKHSASTAEIRGGRLTPAAMHVQYLMGREVYVIGSPRLKDKIRRASDLLSVQLFEHARMPAIWAQWFAARNVQGHDPRTVQRFEHFSVMIPALVAGMGIAIMPRCLVEDDLRQGGLELIFDQPLVTEYGYYLLRQKDCEPTDALNRFTDWLTRACMEKV